MISKIGRKRFRVFGFDVESHNDKDSIKNHETSVWLACLAESENKITDDNIFFYDLRSLLSYLEKISDSKWQNHKRILNNIIVYVYNLSFEWSFLLPVVYEYGFKFKEFIDKKDEYVFNSITTKTCSSVWQAHLKFKTNSGVVLFRDLAKVFPGGLDKVAKSFGISAQKIEVPEDFYTKNRRGNYKVTDFEKRYNFMDVKVILDILDKMNARDDRDFWKSCSASSYSCRKMLKVGFPHAYKPMKIYRRFYPLLEKDESDFLRNGVAGGITYANPIWQFKDIKGNIGHIDIHQAHPSQAYKKIFPYGFGEKFIGKPPTDHAYICCCHVKVSFSGVKLHSVIKLIGIEIGTDIELTVWDFEIVTMKKAYYDLKIEYIDGYAYRTKFLPWRQYYLDNFNKRNEARVIGDKFEEFHRKLLNNSSYGKLLEKGHDLVYENVIENDIIDSKTITKDDASINATFTYLPVGSCIPAYTRCYLVESALKLGYKNILYFDTDSIFFLKNDETARGLKQIDLRNILGAFGVEKDITRAQFACAKRYKLIEKDENDLEKEEYHLAGVNFKEQKIPNYDELNILNGKYKIQGLERCKGGTLIIFKEKELIIQPKFKEIFANNLKRDKIKLD